MKRLTGILLSAVLLAAAPAYADRGHDRDRGYDRHDSHGRHFHKHHGPPRHVVRREVHHYYNAAPAPAYYPPSASTGISIVLPTIYFPFD